MDYKIKALGNIRVIGKKERIYTNYEDNHNGIPELWQDISASGVLAKLLLLSEGELSGVVGVCYNYDEDGSMDYLVGVGTTNNFQDCDVIEIKAAKYAVFGCAMANIQETWREIFENWLPNSEYEFANLPSIEHYPNQEICEIYIPLVK